VTLKIDRSHTTVRLIGRVRAEDLLEVARQLEASGPGAVLQLDEVMLVDVDVVRCLKRCETEGVRLVNCSPYLREWMRREQNRQPKRGCPWRDGGRYPAPGGRRQSRRGRTETTLADTRIRTKPRSAK
jgi:hypothetical protein